MVHYKHTYKYEELTMLAKSLAKTVKEDIRLDMNPYSSSHELASSQANAVLELLENLEKPRPDLIKQEILTYEKKDGKIWITTEIRNYQGDDDYIDSWESECIGGLK